MKKLTIFLIKYIIILDENQAQQVLNFKIDLLILNLQLIQREHINQQIQVKAFTNHNENY
ncbi:hypothetical protein pb186bvf_016266 [Paramecium bursaria]